MSEKMYRFTCDDQCLMNAIENFCPFEDNRSHLKPDSSWFKRAYENDPEVDFYWTEKGLKKYSNSGLKHWHLSVVEGKTKLIIVEKPHSQNSDVILFEDEFQIICRKSMSIDNIKVIREYPFEYQGPRPAATPPIDPRPSFIRHHSSVRDWNAYAGYNGSDEKFTLTASVGVDLGLKKLGIHHEILKPGKRSSWPHAHKLEEELVYILEEEADVWVNGFIHKAYEGDAIFFPPGSGICHTLINNSEKDIVMLVFGEQEVEGDLIYYPFHPNRNAEVREQGKLWSNRPHLSFGMHKGMPGKGIGFAQGVQTNKWEYQISVKNIPSQFIGQNDENKVSVVNKDLGRTLGAKRIALHHQTLPIGFRTSLPHAESLEEEFVYVLKGSPKAWINGFLYQLHEGDSVAFPSGTGIVHTIINNSYEDVELIIAGETTNQNNKFYYPKNLERKEENTNSWWHNPPQQEWGSESEYP